MQNLFPELRCFAEHQLAVSDGHTLHLTESGNLDGIPVVIIHGGPGGGQLSDYRRFFDPEHFRIIQWDQRGCGQSTPHCGLENNTTQHQLDDMEAIRKHLGVDKWMLFGGSWGSTLALLYGQSYPEQTLGFILRGVFLAREQDMNWLYEDGANRIFPDHWQKFIEPVGGRTGFNLVDGYYELLTGNNELKAMQAAKAWAAWEGLCATLKPSPKTIAGMMDPKVALPLATISAHYMHNRCFIEENAVLDNIEKIAHLPAIIVHGRYDMICTLENAQVLFDLWPEAELDVVREAGHSTFELGIIDALLKAVRTMARKLGKEDHHA